MPEQLYKICSLLLLFLYPLAGLPQQSSYIIRKKVLSIEDGLVSREVNCISQDQHGFMWFGTRNGLNRYDGESFISFTKQKGGLRQNKILQLATDYRNQLFIMYGKPGVQHTCNGQIDVLDLTTHQVSSLSQAFPNLPFKEEDVFWISNDGAGALCLIVAHPYSYWRYENGKFTRRLKLSAWTEPAPHSREFAGWGYGYVFQHRQAVLRHKEGVYFITPDTSFIRHQSFTGDGDYGLLGMTKKNEFIVNGWENSGITSFNKILPDGQLIKNISIPAIEGLKYKEANVMFCQNAPAVVFKTRTPSSLLLTDFNGLFTILNEEEMENLPNLEVDQLFVDRQGDYWIISSAGVIYAKIQKNRFTHYFTRSENRSQSLNDQVRGIYSDGEGYVYANMWNNFSLKTPSGRDLVIPNTEILYGLIPYYGSIYTASHTPFEYNKSKHKLNRLTADNKGGEIWSMLALPDSNILMGCTSDLLLFDITGKRFRNILFSSPAIPDPKIVYRIFKSNSSIWAVAENGFYQLNETGNRVIDYYGAEARTADHKFPFSSLHDAWEDEKGYLWFATNGDGLYRWNKSKNEFRQFNITSGFPSDILYRIEGDNFQHLWISTDNGLIHFDKNNFSSRVYTVKEGLSHNEFNRTSSFKDKNGIIYFGGLNGINAFNPADFREDGFVLTTPLQITYFSKFSSDHDKLIDLTTTLAQERKIILNPGDRFLNIVFRLLDFDQNAHFYAYKIEGLDKQWSYIKEGSIRISGLPYGNYTLHIKAQDASGRWSTSELKIPVIVLKPFYLSVWFFAIILLALIIVITLILKLRVYNLKKTNLMLEHKVEKRTEELKLSLEQKEVLFQEVHHRVKNNLQVIASLLELQNAKTDNKEAQMAIIESQNRVFSISFIHQNLYRTGDLKGVEMRTFVNELTGHIRNIFFNPNLTIHVENNICDLIIDIDTAVPFGLIINELMTNSYKYAFTGKTMGTIKLHLSMLDSGSYLFTYEDDGCGIPHGFRIEEAQSLGMRLIQQLSQQIAGRFTYCSEPGIRFELEFKGTEARNKMI